MNRALDGFRALQQRIVRRLVRTAGMRLADPVSRDRCLELIGRLRPYDSGHPLIRIGPKGDGGYLIPDDLEGVRHCFSPGVAGISGFEEDLLNRGIGCFLADYSVESPKITQKYLAFDRKFIGSYSDNRYLTLDEWVHQRLPSDSGDLLLQMDIEGAEYEVLLNVSDELLKRFRILVVEFHFLSRWFDYPFFVVVERVFEKLMRHFDVVHLHPNNYCTIEYVNGIPVPPLMEITFLRKDRFVKKKYRRVFQHPLDFDNTDKDTVVLPRCWCFDALEEAE